MIPAQLKPVIFAADWLKLSSSIRNCFSDWWSFFEFRRPFSVVNKGMGFLEFCSQGRWGFKKADSNYAGLFATFKVYIAHPRNTVVPFQFPTCLFPDSFKLYSSSNYAELFASMWKENKFWDSYIFRELCGVSRVSHIPIRITRG